MSRCEKAEKGPFWRNDEKVAIDAWYSIDEKTKRAENEILAVLNRAEKQIAEKIENAEVCVKRETRPGLGAAAGIYARIGNFCSATWLAKMNRKGAIVNGADCAEVIVREICQILETSKTSNLPTLDRHHADQVLIYGALSREKLEFVAQPENGKMPSHVNTAAYVINAFCGAETVQIDNFTVRINGIGLI